MPPSHQVHKCVDALNTFINANPNDERFAGLNDRTEKMIKYLDKTYPATMAKELGVDPKWIIKKTMYTMVRRFKGHALPPLDEGSNPGDPVSWNYPTDTRPTNTSIESVPVVNIVENTVTPVKRTTRRGSTRTSGVSRRTTALGARRNAATSPRARGRGPRYNAADPDITQYDMFTQFMAASLQNQQHNQEVQATLQANLTDVTSLLGRLGLGQENLQRGQERIERVQAEQGNTQAEQAAVQAEQGNTVVEHAARHDGHDRNFTQMQDYVNNRIEPVLQQVQPALQQFQQVEPALQQFQQVEPVLQRLQQCPQLLQQLLLQQNQAPPNAAGVDNTTGVANNVLASPGGTARAVAPPAAAVTAENKSPRSGSPIQANLLGAFDAAAPPAPAGSVPTTTSVGVGSGQGTPSADNSSFVVPPNEVMVFELWGRVMGQDAGTICVHSVPQTMGGRVGNLSVWRKGVKIDVGVMRGTSFNRFGIASISFMGMEGGVLKLVALTVLKLEDNVPCPKGAKELYGVLTEMAK